MIQAISPITRSTRVGATLRGVSLALAVISGVVGCTASGRNTEGTDIAAMIEETWCSAIVAEGCRDGRDRVERCQYVHYLQFEARAMDRGRARLDEERLDACLGEIGCGLLPSVCREAFVGLGGVGATCESDAECGDELYCALEGRCGVCAPDLSIGDPCQRDPQCGGGSVLDRRAGAACLGTTASESGRCGTREVLEVGAGEACGRTIDSDIHHIERRCTGPLDCVAGFCTGEAAVGEACAGRTCAPGLACAGGTCVMSAQLGEACSPEAPCDPGELLECLYGRCENAPDELGDVCSFFCAGGLRCVEFVCREPSPIGGPCLSNLDCEEGRCSSVGLCEASC